MGFFKRKSLGLQLPPTKGESPEKEARRRHRLSKPQTNKSVTNQPGVTQQPAERNKTDVVCESPNTPTVSKLALEESRIYSKSPNIVPESVPISTARSDEESSNGAPLVTHTSESTHEDRETPSPASIHVPKSKRRPFSNMFASRRNSSIQLKNLGKDSIGTSPHGRVASVTSLNSPISGEDTVEEAPRLERKASFTPGVATRVNKEPVGKPPFSEEDPLPRLHGSENNDIEIADQFGDSDHEHYYDATSELRPSDMLQGFGSEKDWTPPPQINRTATPSDLDYTHLGGLRLGSLHVVNGRASPAPSDFAKQLMRRPSGLRRDASSEYGGSDVGSISADLGDHFPRQHTPPPSAWKGVQVREKSQLQNVYSVSPLQLDDGGLAANTITHPLQISNAPSISNTPQLSPDRASAMAEMYMAEMPESPYSRRRSQSPVGSVLRTTTKVTEYDDDLFEDETVDESVCESADPGPARSNMSAGRTPTPTDEAPQHGDTLGTYINHIGSSPGMHLQLPSIKHGETSDSGYSSNTSLPSLVETKSLVAQRIKAFEQPLVANTTRNIVTNHGRAEERKSAPRSFRPILKQNRATAPEFPTFINLQSTISVATSQNTDASETTASMTSTASTASVPKSPRRLQKKRRSSQSASVQDITVQGSHDLDEISVPPIPDQQRANLNARVSAIPELQHTFKTMDHIKDSASSVGASFSPVEIRFPSPNPEKALEDERPLPSSSSPSRVAKSRDSFLSKIRGARRMSQQGRPSEVREEDARAMVNQIEFTSSELGGPSPYEIAQSVTSSAPSKGDSTHHQMPHDVLKKPSRPKSMMDDRTASEWARSRSKNIFQRDRKASADNQDAFSSAVMPGQIPRPRSFVPPRARTLAYSDEHEVAPPRSLVADPKLQMSAFHQEYPDNEQWEEQNQLPESEEIYWDEHTNVDQYDHAAPPPPKHSPCPSFIEPEEEAEEFSLAPPPPSHSPQPVILDNEDQAQDIWAAQAQAWKNRRKSLGEFLGHSETTDLRYDEYSTRESVPPQEDGLYPSIPPRRPQSSFVQRTPTWEPDTEHHGYYVEQSHHHSNSRGSTAAHGNSYNEEMVRKPRSRRVSQSNSYAGSYAGSLAEELHPAGLERPHPPPQFGRYSGGLNYEYEHGAGFGGSAGTRSCSGVAQGARRGLPLSTGFGVDLSDVPIIAGLKRM